MLLSEQDYHASYDVNDTDSTHQSVNYYANNDAAPDAENGNGLDHEILGETGDVSPQHSNVKSRFPFCYSKSEKEPESEKFGTMFGVYLPCLQSILGVILFLRLPWIVGQAGALLTSAILLLCVSSTFLTALSMSALATNGKIPAGGPYAIVTKTFGPEVGGAVGILYFLGVTIDVSLYVLGAIEAIFVNFDLGRKELLAEESFTDAGLKEFCLNNLGGISDSTNDVFGEVYTRDMCYHNIGLFTFDRELISLGLAVLLGLIVFVGVNFVSKISSILLMVVLLAIVLIFVGLIVLSGDSPTENILRGKLKENLKPNYERDIETKILPTFNSVVSIFYPSVTGILAGSDRSGVLKNPSRSIPLGTLPAIATTTAIYLVFIWMFASIVTNEELKLNKLVVSTVAWPTDSIVGIGIVMSCVGAALQGYIGAPHLLTKIGNDGYISFVTYFINDSKSPREKKWWKISCAATASTKALMLTTVLAGLCCLSGNIDYITPIVTMFYLTMYGVVNLCCFTLSFLRSPGFRPTWVYYHWSTALLGCLVCLVLMFLISTIYALVSIAIAVAVFVFIKRSREQKEWGDAVVGFRLEQAIQSLLALSDMKNIRPHKAGNVEANESAVQKIDEYVHLRGVNWRPQLMVLCKQDPETFQVSRPGLLRFAAQLKKGRGLVTVVSVVEKPRGKKKADVAAAARISLQRQLVEHHVRGFETIICGQYDSISETLDTAFQTQGMGPLQANTVLLSWPREWHMQVLKYSSNILHLESCSATAYAPMDETRDERALSDSALNGGVQCSCLHKCEYVGILKNAIICGKALIVMKSDKKDLYGQKMKDSKRNAMFPSMRKKRALMVLHSTSFDDTIHDDNHDISHSNHHHVQRNLSQKLSWKNIIGHTLLSGRERLLDKPSQQFSDLEKAIDRNKKIKSGSLTIC